MRTSVILVLVCGIFLLGCSRAPEEQQPKSPTIKKGGAFEIVPLYQEEKTDPFKPPEVERGEPIYFSAKDFKMQEYMGKSTQDAAHHWFVFKETGEQWYVDWDADRQLFKTIVIHHSATSNKTTADEIEKIQKERLYAPRYRSESKSPFVKGLPVHSAHVVNGKERFIGYHHLVYNNGKVTTELSPLKKIGDSWWIDHVGWHAGNWSVNCSSIGICLVGDFSENEPPDAQLKATARLIAHYRTIEPKVRITGHGDHTKTECPGKTWPQWKNKIMPR